MGGGGTIKTVKEGTSQGGIKMTKQEIMETLNISEEQIAMLIQINNGDAAQVLANLERMAQEAK